MRCEIENERRSPNYRERLRRCGCGRCYDEYNQLKQAILEAYYFHPAFSRDYYAEVAKSTNSLPTYNPLREAAKSAALAMNYGNSPLKTSMEALMTTTTQPKPITNPAIKLLADRLANVVANRKYAQDQIDYHKSMTKMYGERIAAHDKETSALRKALKKLGHKLDT